ncbi:MAG: imidazole glycerol phosphate synthase subunit HisH [Candidatus Gracilibacteria bacterium]
MIAIIDYGAGNIQSVCNALKKIGQEFKIANSPEGLCGADKIIMPGVGSAGAAMQSLLESNLIEAISGSGVPFLGICLGMQLLADFSEEDGVQCCSIIPGRVRKFNDGRLKVPHMGWNKVERTQKSPLLSGIGDGNYFYFVHSFYFDAPQEFVVAQTIYGLKFPAIIQKDNFYAVQFHPEKSGPMGLQLLRNFCEKC